MKVLAFILLPALLQAATGLQLSHVFGLGKDVAKDEDSSSASAEETTGAKQGPVLAPLPPLPPLPTIPTLPLGRTETIYATKTLFVEVTKKFTEHPVCMTVYGVKPPCFGPHFKKHPKEVQEEEEFYREEGRYINPSASVSRIDATAAPESGLLFEYREGRSENVAEVSGSVLEASDIPEEEVAEREGRYLEFRRPTPSPPSIPAEEAPLDAEGAELAPAQKQMLFENLLPKVVVTKVLTKTLWVTKVEKIIDDHVTATLAIQNCVPVDAKIPFCEVHEHDDEGDHDHYYGKPPPAHPHLPHPHPPPHDDHRDHEHLYKPHPYHPEDYDHHYAPPPPHYDHHSPHHDDYHHAPPPPPHHDDYHHPPPPPPPHHDDYHHAPPPPPPPHHDDYHHAPPPPPPHHDDYHHAPPPPHHDHHHAPPPPPPHHDDYHHAPPPPPPPHHDEHHAPPPPPPPHHEDHHAPPPPPPPYHKPLLEEHLVDYLKPAPPHHYKVGHDHAIDVEYEDDEVHYEHPKSKPEVMPPKKPVAITAAPPKKHVAPPKTTPAPPTTISKPEKPVSVHWRDGQQETEYEE